jgi:chromosome segregation protein
LPIKQQLDQIRSNVRDAGARIRSDYGDFIRLKELEAEVNKNTVEIASLTKQLGTLRTGLKGLSSEDRKTIEQKAKYDDEETIIEALQNRLETAEESVQALAGSFAETADEGDGEFEIHNKTAIKTIREKYAEKFGQIEAGISSLSNLFKPASLKEVTEAVRAGGKLKTAFDKRYEAAKARAQVNQQQLDQIQAIEKRIVSLRKEQTEKRNAMIALGKPEAEYKAQRERWNELHARKVAAVEKQCDQFTALSGGMIKAETKGNLDVAGLTEKLKTAFAGMNISKDKIANICDLLLRSKTPFTEWGVALQELEALALHSMEGPDELPDTPILNKCSFIQTERKRIAASFDSARWIDLSVADLEFNPKFQYSTNKSKDEYIGFSDASAGQQATALLTVLLNQPGAPLIIDQPEDDIDSKLFKEIVERVWRAKSKRQLIFTSHSANFVVNGDAELVACCDYMKAGDQTRGGIKAVGAIDKKEIKEEIILVTEGGRDAFKLRMDQYGF